MPDPAPDPEALARPPAPDARVPLSERVQQWRSDPRVAAGVVAVVLLAAVAVWMRSSAAGSAPPAPSSITTPAAATAAPTTTAKAGPMVHVVGAVRASGVVELPPGARVRDAVAAAGGAADDADLERLNLAAPVTDGQRIAVPRLGDPAPPAVVGDPSPAASGSSGAPAGPLDLNTATATDLETLPGIGPTLAEAIVRAREKLGGFKSVDDLKQVRGIGEARFAEIRDLVTL